ncbi:hypothetical protein JIR001_18930 [Polycladomyces abyssicola]|uniref:ATP-grasp domain-containing protein n=1 Tax=Polycladomyces abyssicola TaxID=1125966 RepID=A0A8D5ZMW5_9BACL|nr:YheC/YheD family protein [Polycladomyces abyssicola]BCU82110.1 hypothetical protein JIR001_18930 [Polycladomyces abyssicola]
MAFQGRLQGKMKINTLLLKDPWISPHIPKTEWLSEESLRAMLQQYETVYVKPNKGYKGIGIFRVRKINSKKCEIQSSMNVEVKIVSLQKAFSFLTEQIKSGRKYIVQQGIELAQLEGRPYDIRIMMHKPLDRWQLSGWVVRLSKRDMVVTNFHREGESISIDRALQDNNWDVAQIAGDLSNLAHLVSNVLDHYYGLRELGIDLAVDNKGKVWYIEANTGPGFRGYKAVSMPMYERVMNTHRFIVKKYS